MSEGPSHTRGGSNRERCTPNDRDNAGENEEERLWYVPPLSMRGNELFVFVVV
jgi:hypothetical protein